MMHESFMHWHLCMFVVRCSCMKLYIENYSLASRSIGASADEEK